MHTILITGATDGLGLALAQRYRQQGSALLLIGRRPLEDLDPALFTPENYCRVDLAQREAASQVEEWLRRRAVTMLDLVIHNAGVGYVGDVAAQPAESVAALVDINLWAPIALSHTLYPFVHCTQGRFVYISSVAADLPSPRYAVYAATKAALDGFVRSWRSELDAEGAGVTLQIIHPGAVRTAMHAKSGADPAAMGWERFPPPDAVASAIERAIRRSPTDATIGGANRLVQWAGGALPDLVDAFATRQGAGSAPSLPATNALPHALVTGGADGIGRALAEHLAEARFVVTAIDRDAERSLHVQAALLNKGGLVRFVTADLRTVRGMQAAADAAAEWSPLQVLIHNAGISCVGSFVRSDLHAQRAVVEVNLLAPLTITAAMLRQRSVAQGAMLVFLSSLSHFIGYPGASVYAATKDGLAAYARSLRVALAPEQVGVLIVYPGPTRTAHARRYSPDNRREQQRMAPEVLASKILAAMERRERCLIAGAGNRLLARAGRLAPHLMALAMRRILYAPLAKQDRA